MRNILIKSVDISAIPENPEMMHIIVILGALKNFEATVLVTEIPTEQLGHAVSTLLNVMQRPSLGHASDVAAMADITEESWSIYNLFDDTLAFHTGGENATVESPLAD